MFQRAVFLDRDGTIAKDVHYCRRVEDLEILPHAPEAIRLLNEHGYKVVVVTNQSGIARGYFTHETLFLIHQKMTADIREQGASIDGIYVCPHHPDDECECRKPKPAMILKAAADLDIALDQSYMIGNDPKDVGAGRAAGCRTIWLTPDRCQQGINLAIPCDHTAASLFEAVQWLLEDASSQSRRLTPIERGSRLP